MSSIMSQINEEINREIDSSENDECTSLDLSPDTASISNEINMENERKRKISYHLGSFRRFGLEHHKIFQVSTTLFI